MGSASSSPSAPPTATRTRLSNSFSPESAARAWCRAAPGDSFGLGVGRTQFSSAFVPFLRQQLNLGLQHEDAFEMYYNAALTHWLNLTADLQVVTPGLTKALNASQQLTSIDTAVILGARLRVRF